jgi:hypothetical protein
MEATMQGSEKPAALKKLDFLFKEAKTNFWIAGGCFIGIVTGSRIKDIDVFTPDAAPVIDEFKSRGYLETFENDWIKNFKHEGLTIQVIKKYAYDSPQKTIDDFDFTIVSAAYNGKEFIAHERFYLDVAQRRIVITNLVKPLNTLKRAMKYASRGFVMCPVGLSRLAKEINLLKIDWENPDQNVIDFYPDGTTTFRGID